MLRTSKLLIEFLCDQRQYNLTLKFFQLLKFGSVNLNCSSLASQFNI